METALVFGDVQIPCHDPQAWEVMLQIAEDLKPQTVVVNGDFVEWRHLSTHYIARKIENFGRDAKEETMLAREKIQELRRRVKAKRWLWNDGNHEWRLWRAISQTPQMMELCGFTNVKATLSPDGLLGITANGFDYAGEYPSGHWLFTGSHENNVFVHHSYQTRKKAGYMAHSEIDTRLCSTITGHGERLAVVWRRGLDRRLFAVEGGNLSILGEPGKGQGIYGSVPFNQPEMMDRQQGFTVVYRDGQTIVPVPVPIHYGRAIFSGRFYKA